MKAQETIRLLGLEPLEFEGGFYRETYRAAKVLGGRSVSTAIYFLLTPEGHSKLHRLQHDEIFHFYLGDAVEQLLLFPDGRAELVTLGTNLVTGERPQAVVPAGVWQGAKLKPAGAHGFALMGTTMAPGFDLRDFELGDRAELSAKYPEWRDWIERLT